MASAVLELDRVGERPRRTSAASPPARVASPAESDLVEEWDRYVTAHAEGTIFHTMAWRDAVQGAFGHEAYYLIALRENYVVGVLPMVLVASRLAGRLLVSMPYGVGGGILADNEETAEELFAAARRIAELCQQGKQQEARNLFAELRDITAELFEHLDQLEQEAKECAPAA